MALVLYKKTLLIILILLATSVSAQPVIQELTMSLTTVLKSGDILDYNLEELKTTYNQNIEKVPWIIKQIIGDERINIYLTTNTGDAIIGGVTENARILEVQEGEIEEPSLNVYVTEATINKLKNQEITIQEAIDTELIKYESVSITTAVKMWFADKALTVVSWFT